MNFFYTSLLMAMLYLNICNVAITMQHDVSTSNSDTKEELIYYNHNCDGCFYCPSCYGCQITKDGACNLKETCRFCCENCRGCKKCKILDCCVNQFHCRVCKKAYEKIQEYYENNDYTKILHAINKKPYLINTVTCDGLSLLAGWIKDITDIKEYESQEEKARGLLDIFTSEGIKNALKYLERHEWIENPWINPHSIKDENVRSFYKDSIAGNDTLKQAVHKLLDLLFSFDREDINEDDVENYKIICNEYFENGNKEDFDNILELLNSDPRLINVIIDTTFGLNIIEYWVLRIKDSTCKDTLYKDLKKFNDFLNYYRANLEGPIYKREILYHLLSDNFWSGNSYIAKVMAIKKIKNKKLRDIKEKYLRLLKELKEW